MDMGQSMPTDMCTHAPWNLPLSLTEKTRTTLRAARNAEFSFFSLTGSVDHTPCRGQQSGQVKSSFFFAGDDRARDCQKSRPTRGALMASSPWL